MAPFVCLVLVCIPLGCARPDSERLVVVTTWSAADRAAIDSDYHPERPIEWVVLAPGENAASVISRIDADVVLGISERRCDELAANGRFVGYEAGDQRPWRVVRSMNLGLAIRNGTTLTKTSAADNSLRGEFVFDDPRIDEVSFAWAKSRLATSNYGDLVRSAANASRAGRASSTTFAVLRNDASIAPATGIEGAIDDATHFDVYPEHPQYREGIAILSNARHDEEAHNFVAFLKARGQADQLRSPAPSAAEIGADALLADLLGATLVDALDDLRSAALAVETPGTSSELNAFLDDLPPWPPASVAKLRAREEPFPLLETLAHEISDDAEGRRWLLQSWDRPIHTVNLAFLREIAGAAKGRLLADPKFRVWLRGEWTAWARQHYRRIAREAGRVGP